MGTRVDSIVVVEIPTWRPSAFQTNSTEGLLTIASMPRAYLWFSNTPMSIWPFVVFSRGNFTRMLILWYRLSPDRQGRSASLTNVHFFL